MERVRNVGKGDREWPDWYGRDGMGKIVGQDGEGKWDGESRGLPAGGWLATGA